MTDQKQGFRRRKLSRKEFFVVTALVAILILLTVGLWPRLAEERRYRSCQANLKEIGQAMGIYTAESKGERFPPLKMKDCNGAIQPFSGAMDFTAVFPEYLSDYNLFVCPSFEHGKTAVEIWDEGRTGNPRWKRVEGFSGNGAVDPCEVLGSPYYYYGWALSDLMFASRDRSEDAEPEDYVPEEFKSWGRSVWVTEKYTPHIHNMRFRLATLALADKLASGRAESSAHWEMEYPSGKKLRLPNGTFVPILEEEAYMYYRRDIGNAGESSTIRAQIVVLHEDLKHPRAFLPSALAHANVLYMDGHVEGMAWLRGSKFPYNEAGEILREAVAGTLKMPEGYAIQAAPTQGN
jgi:prepilin-type processing-associated H-X9-DG protein